MVIAPQERLGARVTQAGWWGALDGSRWMLLAHFLLRLLGLGTAVVLTLMTADESGAGLGPLWIFGALAVWGVLVLAVALGLGLSPGRLALVQFGGDVVILLAGPVLVPVWGSTVAILAVLLAVAPVALAAPWTGLAGYVVVLAGYLAAGTSGASGVVLELPSVRTGAFVYGLVGVAAATGLAALLRRQQARIQVELDRAQEAQAQLGAILDASRDPLVLVDPAGRLVASNAATADSFGLDPAEFSGKPLEDLLPALERIFGDPAMGQELRRQLDNRDPGRVFRGTVIQRWPVTREFDARSMPVFDADGRYRGRMWVFQDVTAQRAQDRQREAFLDLASRELRTPLAALRGLLDQLVTDPALAADPESARRALAHARESAVRWEAMVDDLTLLGRLEAGQFPLQRAALPAGPLLHGLREQYRALAEARGVSLRVQDQTGGRAVWADPEWLPVILGHLLRNAIQYSGGPGAVTVSAEVRGEEVHLTVTDSGIGLTAEDQERLFVPFYRSARRAVQEQPGVGLGLPITRRLVEHHGGRITVTSEAGHGTVVRVVLPAAASES